MRPSRSVTSSVVSAIAGASSISFSGVFVQLGGLPAEQSSFLRTLYALPILAVVSLWLRRKERRPLRGLFRSAVILVGMFEGLEVIAYHASIPYLGSFTSVTLLLQPALALVWGVLLLGEPLDAYKAIGGGCALIGIIVAQHANACGIGTHDQRAPSANRIWT